ncbi:hypothetical protein KKF59_00120 [Patescibacteria group bacterium]|nr:hypothetical protein [Patescibacteria group bacterium]MBU1907524.1 hypothetical protein [Patescibacteria group bacterium]
MTNLLIILAAVFIVVVVALIIFLKLFEGGVDEEKKKYQYKRRNFFLSRAEHECFDALTTVVGSDYLIFAQVHLPTLVDNKVVGQDWRYF